eukprot:TRINITY_DN15910_c0_g1_i1.p1 TRINITY_DN15910_c0_g1~~TRINITY_DN15910_c0_g1_i1.p1  ORF type:complete len:117 (+),score=13.90 TRINITY_DN15910_c0_g1_i1:32-382(+)
MSMHPHNRQFKLYIERATRHLPQPNPFVSFEFDEYYVYVGIKPNFFKHMMRVLKLVNPESTLGELWEFLDNHCMIDKESLIKIRMGTSRSIQIYLQRHHFSSFIHLYRNLHHYFNF